MASEYFCNLDANFLRLDHLQRPELNKGTVDFAVSEEYWTPQPPPSIRPLYYSVVPQPTTGVRKPQPMDYVFVFDVSQEAVRSGFLKTACAVLLAALFGDGESIPPCFPQESRIAILAFDRTLQFYNLSVRLLPLLHAFIPLYNMSFLSQKSRGSRRCWLCQMWRTCSCRLSLVFS